MVKTKTRPKRYQNPEPPKRRHVRHILRWLLTRRPSKWPRKIKITQQKIPKARVGKGDLRVTFINHSTVLIQMDGINILTDPIWSKRCGPTRLTSIKRVAPPGVRFEDLPRIDLVLVSHNHYDHMDIPTLRKLQREHDPVFCVSRGNLEKLRAKKFKKLIDFEWWEQKGLLKGLQITYVPAKHFSRRGLWDHNKTLWGGFVIEGSKGNVYFAGDTAYSKHFKEIYKKFGPMRLSLLPIGAYAPRWFMKSVHMNPEEAVLAHQDLRSRQSVAIHFGTFRLSDEAIDQPLKDLDHALHKHHVKLSNFLALYPGEGIDV